ncbi:ferrous iron transport protein A [ANME-1 cluster archaeon AG-394-G21]|nr:ferrous iron transport protein A [ANME-1 cluster archaeon AG-394-G21]
MEKKLTEMVFDEEGTVKAISEDFKEQIAGMGIREGKKVRMTTRQPMNGPLVIEIGSANTSVGYALADKVIVDVGD